MMNNSNIDVEFCSIFFYPYNLEVNIDHIDIREDEVNEISATSIKLDSETGEPLDYTESSCDYDSLIMLWEHFGEDRDSLDELLIKWKKIKLENLDSYYDCDTF